MTKFYLATVLIALQYLTITADKMDKTIKTARKPLWNETYLDKLKKDLFLNYDRFVRPENYHNVTEITVHLTILYLATDESKSVIVLDCWITLEWNDSKLRWIKENYGGLNMIQISNHEVWKPDIYVYNSILDGNEPFGMGNTNVVIHPNGHVVWVPSVKLTIICNFDLRYWPFDRHHCPIKFTSWTLSSSQLRYSNNTELYLDMATFGSSWNIEGKGELLRDQYPCCPKSFETVVFHLNITRKMTPYCAIVVAPAVVCTFMVLAQFTLPPNAEEKIILNGFTVVLLNFFLFYFNKQVYSSGSQSPLIVLFYSWCLYLAGVGTTVSVVLYLLSIVEKTHSPLRCIMDVQKRLAKWLCVTGAEDWISVAACVDRLIFMAYALIFFGIAIAFT